MSKESIPAAWHVTDEPSAGGQKPKNHRTTALILSIVAGVIVLSAVGFGVFALLRAGDAHNSPPVATKPPEFTFADNTKVSGLDVSGKTVAQAKAYLESYRDSLVSPIVITINIAGNEATLSQENFKYTDNIDEVINQMQADANRGMADTLPPDYKVKVTATEASVNSCVQQLSDEFNTEPKNARVSAFHPYQPERFTFEEARPGHKLDTESLKTQLISALASGQKLVHLEAITDKIEPSVTTEYLKKNLVKLSSYQTVSTNTDNATHNMKLALSSCSGSVIEPWNTWSFNDCTGDSNLESNGYKSAHVIFQGKLIDGIGGGICQASSTIYNAAIRANMGIEERANHKWASVYVPTGLDATIDYPYLDLKLTNNTDYQMFLECKVEGSTLYASFWGVRDGDYDEIKTKNEQGETGKENYAVKAWRVYYKGGKKVGEEALPDSSYDLENGVVFYSAENDDGAQDTNVDEPATKASS